MTRSVRRAGFGRTAAFALLFAQFALASACGAAPAPRRPASATAFVRAASLARGIAIWRWFDRPAVETDAHYAGYVTDAELAQLRRWGFTAIRLPLGEPFLFAGGDAATPLPARVRLLRAAIARITAAGLAVVVDYHPDPKLKIRMETEPALREQTVRMWKALAHALADTDPDRVMLELLNEPRFQRDGAGWNTFMTQLHDVVRAAAPDHTIIADSADYAALDRLPDMAVLADPNMIYTVHFYTPMPFTAQGMEWNTKGLRGLIWPGDAPGCGAAQGAEAGPATVTDWAAEKIGKADTPAAAARKYCAGGWNAARMERDIAAVADWSRANRRPVWIGEFGVLALEAPADSRRRWFAAAARTFARHGLPWSLWSYDDCWGLSLKAVCAPPGAANRMGALATCQTLRAIGMAEPRRCLAEVRALRTPGLAATAPGAGR